MSFGTIIDVRIPQIEKGYIPAQDNETYCLREIGEENYDVVLVDNCILGRPTNLLKIAKKFMEEGDFDTAGKIICGGLVFEKQLYDMTLEGRLKTIGPIIKEYQGCVNSLRRRLPKLKNGLLSEEGRRQLIDLFELSQDSQNPLVENRVSIKSDDDYRKTEERFRNSPYCVDAYVRLDGTIKKVSDTDLALYTTGLMLEVFKGMKCAIITHDEDFLHQGPFVARVTSKNQRKKLGLPNELFSASPDIFYPSKQVAELPVEFRRFQHPTSLEHAKYLN